MHYKGMEALQELEVLITIHLKFYFRFAERYLQPINMSKISKLNPDKTSSIDLYEELLNKYTYDYTQLSSIHTITAKLASEEHETPQKRDRTSSRAPISEVKLFLQACR